MRNKKATAMFIILFLFFYLLPINTVRVYGEELPAISYTFNKNNITVGDTFEITVNITNTNGLYATSLDLKYDPSLMSIDGINKGNIFSEQESVSEIVKHDNLNGTISVYNSLIGNKVGVSKEQASLFVIKATALKSGLQPLNTINSLEGLSDINNVCLKLSNESGQPIQYTSNNSKIEFIGGYDATSNEISYTGWWGVSGSSKYSLSGNSQAEFSFYGSSIRVYGIKNSSKGIADIYIDGVLRKSVDTYSSSFINNALIYEGINLTNSRHTIRVVTSGRKNSASAGVGIALSSFHIGNSRANVSSGVHSVLTRDYINISPWWSQAGQSIYSFEKGASIDFYFRGKSVSIFGVKNSSKGIANIYIDGELVNKVDTYSSSNISDGLITSISGLEDKNHKVTIEVSGEKSLNSLGHSLAITKFAVGDATTHAFENGGYEEDSRFIKYTGWWGSSRGTKYAMNRGDSAEFSFYGDNIRVYGIMNETKGIANVYIDGVLDRTIDGYSKDEVNVALLYEKKNLSNGYHSIKIELTNTKNPSSKGTSFTIDSFYLGTELPTASLSGVYQQNSGVIKYMGWWGSAGATNYSVNTGNYAELEFIGSSISVYGIKNNSKGKANIYIDNNLVTKIDTYSADALSNVLLYEINGLTLGKHKLRVEVAGERNPASSANSIAVDYFRVQ